jgi:hypothetical protein
VRARPFLYTFSGRSFTRPFQKLWGGDPQAAQGAGRMIDSRTAAHTAIYTALAAATAVTDLADVWGHAEEGTEPTESKGLVLIGLASASNLASKDGGWTK